jgi:hypothetical protein
MCQSNVKNANRSRTKLSVDTGSNFGADSNPDPSPDIPSGHAEISPSGNQDPCDNREKNNLAVPPPAEEFASTDMVKKTR